MDHSTFRIIYGIVFAAIIIFYLYGKTWKLNEVRDELTDMRVNDPTNPDVAALQRRFNFWDKVPSLAMIAAALGMIIISGAGLLD